MQYDFLVPITVFSINHCGEFEIFLFYYAWVRNAMWLITIFQGCQQAIENPAVCNSKKKKCWYNTLKNDTNVICGKQLCAPFHPHLAFDSDQNLSKLSRNGPVGQAYSTYSRGSFSSKFWSFTWLTNHSRANCESLLPTAANAFSLNRNTKQKNKLKMM